MKADEKMFKEAHIRSGDAVQKIRRRGPVPPDVPERESTLPVGRNNFLIAIVVVDPKRPCDFTMDVMQNYRVSARNRTADSDAAG